MTETTIIASVAAGIAGLSIKDWIVLSGMKTRMERIEGKMDEALKLSSRLGALEESVAKMREALCPTTLCAERRQSAADKFKSIELTISAGFGDMKLSIDELWKKIDILFGRDKV